MNPQQAELERGTTEPNAAITGTRSLILKWEGDRKNATAAAQKYIFHLFSSEILVLGCLVMERGEMRDRQTATLVLKHGIPIRQDMRGWCFILRKRMTTTILFILYQL